MPANHTEVEKRLWEAADELRANSKLKSSEYPVPVLGLIFLRYADQKFTELENKLISGNGRRKIGRTDFQGAFGNEPSQEARAHPSLDIFPKELTSRKRSNRSLCKC